MKLLIVFAFVCVCYASAISYTLENCKCGEGFIARKGSKEKVECHGQRLKMIKPCNIPDVPECVCTKNTITGVMTDTEGTWCTQSKEGVIELKWACENAADWEAYKIEWTKFEQSLKE